MRTSMARDSASPLVRAAAAQVYPVKVPGIKEIARVHQGQRQLQKAVLTARTQMTLQMHTWLWIFQILKLAI